jgi:hypothetical protein
MRKAKGVAGPQTPEKPDGVRERAKAIAQTDRLGAEGGTKLEDLGRGSVVGEQKPLFGEADNIVNALTLERSLIKTEIKAIAKAISSKERTMEALEEREKKLTKALETAKKMGREKTEKKVDPEGAL